MGDSWGNQGERTMKKGNRYFSPLTFNLLAVVWIIGFLPLAVAFVSNVGSDPNNDDYQQMTVPPEKLWFNEGESFLSHPRLCDNPNPDLDRMECTGKTLSWVENGGIDNYPYYQFVNPNVSAWDLDCVYITDGVCKGSYDAQDNNDVLNFGSYFGDCDTIGLYYQNPVINSPPQGALYESQVQYNCEFADPDWSYYEPILTQQTYTQSLTYEGSYFYRGYDSDNFGIGTANPNNITDGSWVGDSGDTFSFRLNELMMNQLPHGEMVDSMRLTIFDFPSAPLGNPSTYNCDNYAGWANLSINTKVSIEYDGEMRELATTYITETDNKWYYTATPSFFPQSGCYVGYEVLIDFNGFDAREMYNFANGGEWNLSTMIIEMEFERTDGGNLGSTNVAINGISNFQIAIDYTEIESQQVEFATNAGLLTMGSANIILAIASTPYWDPFRNFFRGRL